MTAGVWSRFRIHMESGGTRTVSDTGEVVR